MLYAELLKVDNVELSFTEDALEEIANMAFIENETTENIGIIKDLIIKPREFKVFNISDTDTLKLDNGVKFMFGETYGLEVEDKKSQVSGLGGKYLTDYGVPNEIDFAFVIVPVGKGD